MLRATAASLSEVYDLAMLDLDGVVYVGTEAVPGAPEAVIEARSAGMRVAFITNNAARTPDEVAAHLRELDVAAEAADVVTSAQAAARVLVDKHGAGSRIVCLGGPGLREALLAEGLEPVGSDEDAVAVASGYGPELAWKDVMRVAVRVRQGLPWVASNTDATIPTSYGVAPGHGALVELLERFTGVTPVVAGKPERPLLDETVRRVGGSRPLMVGDRLDTDIEGAHNAGIDSLLVLTGVTGLAELVAAGPNQRPTYISERLEGLTGAHPRPDRDGEAWVLPGWRASVVDGALVVEESAGGEPSDFWRVAAAAGWAHRDATGTVPRIDGVAR